MVGAEPAPAMSRGVQARLAEALLLTEDPSASDSLRAAEISAWYRSGGADPLAARPRARPQLPSDGPTPFWLFCVPFEDMLDSTGADPTRLPQEAVRACWRAVEGRVAAEPGETLEWGLAALAEKARLDGTDLDPAAIDVIGGRWWPIWQQSLTSAIADARAGHLEILVGRNGRKLLAEAETVAAILRLAGPIQRLKGLLGPPPIAHLSSAQKSAIRSELESLGRAHRREVWSDPRIVAHVVAQRLENPAELFVMTAQLELGAVSEHGKRLGEAREPLILARSAKQLAALDEMPPTGSAVPEIIAACEIAAGALASAAELEHHGASAAYLRELARLQEAFAQRLGTTIMPVLRAEIVAPWQDGGEDARSDAAGVLRAEAVARGLARLTRSTAPIGAETAVRPQIAALLDEIEAIVARLAEGLKAAADRGETAVGSGAALVNAVRTLELLAGSDRAHALVSTHAALLNAAWAEAERDIVV